MQLTNQLSYVIKVTIKHLLLTYKTFTVKLTCDTLLTYKILFAYCLLVKVSIL